MEDNSIDIKQVKHPIRIVKKTKFQKLKHEYSMFLLDHYPIKIGLEYLWIAIATFISAFALAYGYRTFTAPEGAPSLISGGASGFSQVLVTIINLCGFNSVPAKDLQSILYFVVNIPLFILAWFKIGKKFTIISLINVGLTSILISYIPNSWTSIFNVDPNSVVEGIPFQYDYLVRALCAGSLTGISSGVAYAIGTSAGGVDIITFTIAEKKSTNVGKYNIIINACIVVAYTFFNALKINSLSQIPVSIYTIAYFIACAKVIDLINTKNKKIELQINTDHLELAQKLTRAFPHGCTICDAVGGYSGNQRKLIYMTVSSNELKNVINFVKKEDPYCFVNVSYATQVYGKFYIKPIK